MADSRTPGARSGLRALALYVYAAGMLIAVLSAALEPRELKDIPHGILVGLLVTRLSLVALPLTADPPAPRLAIVELLAWVVAVIAALPGLLPAVFLFPLLPVLPADAISLFALTFGIATLESLGAAIRATIRTAAALLSEVRDPGGIRAGLTAAMASVGVTAVGALLAYGPPLEWLDPPVTLDARTCISLAVLGALVFAGRMAVEDTRVIEVVSGYDQPRVGWGSTARVAVLLAGIEGIVVAGSAALAPYGLIPSSLMVEASATHPELAQDGVTEDLFRMAQRRSGISAGGQRFIVRYGAHVAPPPFDSTATFTADKAVLILVNEDIPASRRRNVVVYQFASSLLALNAPTVARSVGQGYAYWAAENTRNPFVVGLRSGYSPRAVCAAGAGDPLRQPALFSSSLSSLPFIAAEGHGGSAASQQLLLEIAHSDTTGFVRRVAAACDGYVVDRFPVPPELTVRPAPPGAVPIDEVLARAAFDEARHRSGLDAVGQPIEVVVGPAPPGRTTYSDFTDGTHVIVTVSPSLPADRRRESLVFQFVGIFATLRFGGQTEPLRSGFAFWASQAREDPFVTGDPSGRSMCEKAATVDLTTATRTSAYLSSIPFIDAEREGGLASAHKLADERMAPSIDIAGWHALIQRGCELRYP